MTRPDERVREMLAESGIPAVGSEELVECLTALERHVDATPPVPGPELAALLAPRPVAAPIPFPRRHRRVLVAGVLALGTVAAGGIAAAANELPPSAQTVVAKFSERFLPFTLPRPDDRPMPDGDAPAPADDYEPAIDDYLIIPESAAVPAPPAPTTTATPAPSAPATPLASPSSLPSPALPAPSGEVSAVPSPAPTSAPDGDEAESGGTDGSQAAPGEEVTTAPSTGESAPASPAPSSPPPSAGPSPSPSPTVSSRRGNGQKRAPGQNKERPSDRASGGVWSDG